MFPFYLGMHYKWPLFNGYEWISKLEVVVMIDFIMIKLGQDYDNCTNAKSFPHSSKPVLLKKIRKVWQAYPEYDESNTLLIDDSPYKALCNPVCINSLFWIYCRLYMCLLFFLSSNFSLKEGTTIFPRSYCYKNKYNDSSLGEIPLVPLLSFL